MYGYLKLSNILIQITSGMTKTEILAQALLFLLGGYDTTASTLSFLLHELTLNPDVQQTLYEEINEKLGDQVVYDRIKMYMS